MHSRARPCDRASSTLLCYGNYIKIILFHIWLVSYIDSQSSWDFFFLHYFKVTFSIIFVTKIRDDNPSIVYQQYDYMKAHLMIENNVIISKNYLPSPCTVCQQWYRDITKNITNFPVLYHILYWHFLWPTAASQASASARKCTCVWRGRGRRGALLHPSLEPRRAGPPLLQTLDLPLVITAPSMSKCESLGSDLDDVVRMCGSRVGYVRIS